MAFGHERDELAHRRWRTAVGLALSVLGLLIAWRTWRRPRKPQAPAQAPAQEG